MSSKPKLKTLKPRLQTVGSRQQSVQTTRPGTVERKRGSAGVKDRERIRKRDCAPCHEAKTTRETAERAAACYGAAW